MLHVFPYYQTDTNFNLYIITLICRQAVPFYFTVSAFLYFQKENDLKRLGHYILRTLILYLIWSLAYLPLWLQAHPLQSDSFFFELFQSFVLVGFYYHLWFLPACIFGMLIVAFLLKRVPDWLGWIVVIGLYIIGMLLNQYPDTIQTLGLQSFSDQVFYFLKTARNGFFYSPVFFMIGKALKNDPKISMILALLLYILSVGLLWGEGLWNLSQGIDLLHHLTVFYLALPLCIGFLVWFLIQKQLKDHPFYGFLRRSSTIIYTSHVLFVELFKEMDFSFPGLYLIVAACSTALAFVIVFASRWIKILKYLY